MQLVQIVERERQARLSRLIAVWPHELTDTSAEGRLWVCKLLRKALRAERRRGVSGHGAYSVTRHAALLRVYRIELVELRCLIERERFQAVRAASGIRLH